MKSEHENPHRELCKQMMKNALDAAEHIGAILAKAEENRHIDPAKLETIKTLNGIICAYLSGTK